jgi:hypothetical protein
MALLVFFRSPVFLLLYACMISSLHAEDKAQVVIYKETSFDFDGAYKLSSPTLPDLLVKVIVSSGHYLDFPNQRIWVPELKKVELRFTLLGVERSVQIIHQKHAHAKLSGLQPIKTCYWYPAIKQLACDLRTQFFGTEKEKKGLLVLSKSKKKQKTIHIQSLEECEFHTLCAVERRLSPKGSHTHIKNVYVDISENNVRGKKAVIAHTRFWQELFQGVTTQYSGVGFKIKKQSYHAFSFDHFDRQSPWYPAIKKVAKMKVERYLQCKRTLSLVRKECTLP